MSPVVCINTQNSVPSSLTFQFQVQFHQSMIHMATTSSSSSAQQQQPCGACRFLRRKCTWDCIFAPHFSSEQGPSIFAAIHRVFGASNVSKLLSHVPLHARPDAITTISFEAQSRIKDPIYGCVSHVLALQQQVEYLQDQVMQMRAQLEQNTIDDDPFSRIAENHQWTNSNNVTVGDEDVSCEGYYSMQRPSYTQLSELQELALRMMNNKN